MTFRCVFGCPLEYQLLRGEYSVARGGNSPIIDLVL